MTETTPRYQASKTCGDCSLSGGGICAVTLAGVEPTMPACKRHRQRVEREEDQIDIERPPDPWTTGADGVDVTNSICVNCTHCVTRPGKDGMRDYANAQCRLHRLIASIERLECDDFQHWTIPLQRRTDEIDASGVQNRQVGGDHYVRHAIQPWDIWREYNLDPWEASALKYLLRRKGKRLEDLEKCRHCLDYLIERERATGGV
jgi:hypothetical protein